MTMKLWAVAALFTKPGGGLEDSILLSLTFVHEQAEIATACVVSRFYTDNPSKIDYLLHGIHAFAATEEQVELLKGDSKSKLAAVLQLVPQSGRVMSCKSPRGCQWGVCCVEEGRCMWGRMGLREGYFDEQFTEVSAEEVALERTSRPETPPDGAA